MRINLAELKKWCDVSFYFKDFLLTYLNGNSNGIEFNTLKELNFIKNDKIELSNIEMYDDYLFEIALELLLMRYIRGNVSNTIINDDDFYKKFYVMDEEEILAMGNLEFDIKDSIEYKSLRHYNILDENGDVIINNINVPKIKTLYIDFSLEKLRSGDKTHINNLYKMKIVE